MQFVRSSGSVKIVGLMERVDDYAIQALVEERSGAPLFGWKIDATSREGQAHIGVDG